MSDLEETLAFQIRALKLPVPTRELVFHRLTHGTEGRSWRFDFSWPEKLLAAEVDGGTKMRKSRHTSMKGFEEDCVKQCEAVIDGWRVMKFTADMVKDGRAIALLERALA